MREDLQAVFIANMFLAANEVSSFFLVAVDGL